MLPHTCTVAGAAATGAIQPGKWGHTRSLRRCEDTRTSAEMHWRSRRAVPDPGPHQHSAAASPHTSPTPQEKGWRRAGGRAAQQACGTPLAQAGPPPPPPPSTQMAFRRPHAAACAYLPGQPPRSRVSSGASSGAYGHRDRLTLSRCTTSRCLAGGPQSAVPSAGITGWHGRRKPRRRKTRRAVTGWQYSQSHPVYAGARPRFSRLQECTHAGCRRGGAVPGWKGSRGCPCRGGGIRAWRASAGLARAGKPVLY